MLDFKKRRRADIEIGRCEKCYYTYCCPDKKLKEITYEKKRLELSIAAEKAIEIKTEIFEIWKSLDQFRLLIKLILNESQCFMLQNRGKQLITNEVNLLNNDQQVINLEEIKMERQKAKLGEYLESKKLTNNLTEIDILLLEYLDKDVKNSIKFKYDY